MRLIQTVGKLLDKLIVTQKLFVGGCISLLRPTGEIRNYLDRCDIYRSCCYQFASLSTRFVFSKFVVCPLRFFMFGWQGTVSRNLVRVSCTLETLNITVYHHWIFNFDNLSACVINKTYSMAWAHSRLYTTLRSFCHSGERKN